MTTLFPLPSPALPEFTTLLLKGPFHASAPIHLCLTHLANRPGTRAVFLTPSRDNFVAALRDLNDDWLNECGGFGAVYEVLSRVEVFYPPTPSHASLALSMLRVAHPEKAPSQQEISSPCLVLLHELSSYFLDGDGLHNVASYLSVVAHALTTLKSLSEHESRYVCPFEFSRTKIRQALRPRVSLVLMDSKLDSLSLPVLRPSIHAPEVELGGQSDPPYRVGFLVDRYFEWVEDTSPSQPGSLTHTLRLRETARGDDGDDVVLLWKRIDGKGRVFTDRPGVSYTWQ
ncbi:hypothetical protein EDB86DRAFT_299594 [Lactarius hatsudake]|nr:hypothetical protein EDB86DRAFT_299594 [Lactarius hatsudake]